jgi:hypothetical protein
MVALLAIVSTNKAMQRNGGSLRLDMDTRFPPSADGGRSAENESRSTEHHMKRFTSIFTIVSGVIFCFSLALFPVSYHLELTDIDAASGQLLSPHSVPVTTNVRCTPFEGSIWLFSNNIPYTGSIRYLGDDDWIAYDGGTAVRKQNWRWQLGAYGLVQFRYTGDDGVCVGMDTSGDFPGIYYRHFDWLKDPWPWWTVRFSLLYPVLLFGCIPVMWTIGALRGRTKR